MNGRSILAVFAGIVVGIAVISFLQSLLVFVYPEHIKAMKNLKELAELEKYMLSLPTGMYLLASFTHALGLLCGMIVGHMIDRKNGMTMIVVASLLLLGNVLNFLVVPHPGWFPLLDLGLSVGFGLAYGVFVWRRSRK